MELVDSFDELESSRSVCGKNFPNFEMLDAKIASGSVPRNRKPKERTGFYEDDRSHS